MPKRLAVLGQPVAHSRSPAMQTAALAELGLAEEWSYEAIDVAPEDFDERVRAMPGEGFVGVNVTVPHKLAALASPTRLREAARAIGAANTLTFADGGSPPRTPTRAGSSTRMRRVPVAGARALVLGAGGSARAAIWALVTPAPRSRSGTARPRRPTDWRASSGRPQRPSNRRRRADPSTCS